jgi:hypothetical protein
MTSWPLHLEAWVLNDDLDDRHLPAGAAAAVVTWQLRLPRQRPRLQPADRPDRLDRSMMDLYFGAVARLEHFWQTLRLARVGIQKV